MFLSKLKLLRFFIVGLLFLNIFFSVVPILPFRSVLFLVIAALLAFLDFYQNGIKSEVLEKLKKASIFLALFFGAILISLILNLFAFSNTKELTIMIEKYLILLTNALLFIIILRYGLEDKKLLKIFYFAFLGPMLLIPVFYLTQKPVIPELMDTVYGTSSFALKQFIGGPNYAFVGLLIFPAVFLFYMLFIKTSYISKIFSFGGLILVTILILWSASRATWFVLFVALVFLGIKLVWDNKRRLIYVMAVPIFVSVVFGISFLFLPCQVKLAVLARVNTQAITVFSDFVYDFWPLQSIWSSPATQQCSRSLNALLVGTFKFEYLNVFMSQNRQGLWVQAFDLSLDKPFGYGPFLDPFVKLDEGGGRLISTPHNFLFESGLVGGVLTVLILVYFLFWSLKFIFNFSASYYKSEFLSIVNPVFFAVILRFMFFDGLFFRWFWALAAIFVAFRFYIENKKAIQIPLLIPKSVKEV